ncbi:SAM-dependent DNA methyltransferase [Agromyces endophyticus]|uniref:DNA methyltransferase n=1 Tax=Agromyces sp. H17E-10 TaxID=2932244 RepID=UPI001FD2B72B|nr:DNA methyltransferase [Agromyces sp. H17E-10]UOQ88055.1 SAM-dependent DNA methyltransferase [Agromyces sp. H17E-10]
MAARPFRKSRTPEWEWLSIIDADGPFLSRTALKSFYPQGLPKADASVDDVNATFVDEFARWSTAWSSSAEEYAESRDRWVEAVLRTLLDWSDDLQLSPTGIEAKSPNGAVMVTPFAALDGGDGDAPAALVTVVDRTENLRSVGADGWSANAIDRMAVLLRETGTTIGIVTDGRWWALVSAAKDVTTASGVWDALLWREERPSRDAFLSLASFASIAGGQPEKRLPLLFAESVASAEQITEALGDQVRRAVELVLQSMSDTHLRAIAHGDSSPLPEDPKLVYEGAVTMLMRIVFLLFAEERGLLPEHDLYRSSYAIAGLREQLQRAATATSDEALDHSWEAWHRLLAASNAVFNGVSYPDARMPAYGGSLFDPGRFPWLQATDAQGRLQVRLTDRAMLAVLRAVQTIEDGAMQLSFRDLDVEQIGYVYEGLLGYSAEYVAEVIVGLHGKAGFEPEIPLRELEQLATDASSPKDFGEKLVAHLKKTQEHAKSRTAGQIAKAYGTVDADAAADARTRLRHALLGDDELAARLEPFHALIRDDLRGFPYVVPAGGLVMTESSQRANTGTHYTPRSLAEEVVLHALEPLVYSPGPLDVEDSTHWKLRSSAEILDLKVADIAAGSGAFLVAAARYLADRLIEARELEGVPIGGDDPKRFAVREIVARCLYGADINGMAVEMCKLSLWLISMDPGKPFSFVDDRVFHGNSLLGVTTEAQLKAQHIYPKDSVKRQLAAFDVDKDLEDAARLRRELASGQVDDADRMRSTRAKRALLEQSKHVTAKLRDVADGIIAAGLLEGGKPGRKLEERYDELAEALRDAYPVDGSAGERRRLDAIIDAGLTPTVDTGEARWKPLHWILEAPDVVHDHGGFDAIIGNPPFLGSQKLVGAIGASARSLLVEVVADGQPGTADLVAYFVLRSHALMRASEATFGLIATNTVAQGVTREVGLDQLVGVSVTVFRAVRSAKWPSRNANLEFAAIWATNSDLSAEVRVIADGVPVSKVSSMLEPQGRGNGIPFELRENAGVAFQGSSPLGTGFAMTSDEAQALIQEDPGSERVIRPYLSGEDLVSRPSNDASRMIIDFFDSSESRARMFPAAFGRVEELVLPERRRTRPDGTFVLRTPLPDRWWQYAERRPGLYRAIADTAQVIAIPRVSKVVLPSLCVSTQVFSEQVVVLALNDGADLAFLSSAAHLLWSFTYSSTLESRVRYSPQSVFGTLPRPTNSERMRGLGEQLDGDRREIMLRRQLGLTALYNLVNSPDVQGDADVDLIRSIHMQIDEAVMEAYGWTDIPLDHGFHTYRQMERWTVSPAARVEILDRLLEENHRRAAIEAPQNPKKAKRGKSLEESEKPEGAMF